MGIGGATARRLASDGARVLIADIEEQAANRNAQTIQAAGGTAEVIVADVSSLDGVRSTIERAVERWGRLDIVVNNAYSGVYRGSAVDLPEEHWDRGFDIGLKAMYRAAKYAVPHLRQSGSGSIVNLSSVHGMLVAPGALVYETVKSAVIGLTRQLAAEYGPDNIRVNAICPGHIVTERIQLDVADPNNDDNGPGTTPTRPRATSTPARSICSSSRCSTTGRISSFECARATCRRPLAVRWGAARGRVRARSSGRINLDGGVVRAAQLHDSRPAGRGVACWRCTASDSATWMQAATRWARSRSAPTPSRGSSRSACRARRWVACLGQARALRSADRRTASVPTRRGVCADAAAVPVRRVRDGQRRAALHVQSRPGAEGGGRAHPERRQPG